MAVGIITPAVGSLPATPAATKQTLAGAYVDLRDSGWAQQYLPDLMEKEAEVFGNRTISGFLAQVGAEEAMAAERGRRKGRGSTIVTGLTDEQKPTVGRPTLLG